MPVSIRTKEMFLASLIDSLRAGSIITQFPPEISTIRQICEGIAANEADLSYDLIQVLTSWYIGTARGPDLVRRMRDQGLEPDAGQAASDPVTFTRVQTWLEDIPLVAPQMLQATLTDGSPVLYQSVGTFTLMPQGRSISGQSPTSIVTSGTNDQLRVNLDGDGIRSLTLGTQSTGAAIAARIQTLVRALTANTVGNQPAYDGFRCDYQSLTPGAYTLRSGSTGPLSSIMVLPGTAHDATGDLHLGLAHGGLETPGQDSLNVPMLCTTLGLKGNVGSGQINQQVTPVAGIQSVINLLAFSNGREPASDDASRQDLRSYLLGLGRGTTDAIERAVLHTQGSDGQRHVLSAQVLYGSGVIQVYVCDGRSLTVGAQTDVLQDVQDELDGRGSVPGPWYAAGSIAGVAPALLVPFNIDVTVLVGPSVNKVLARQQIITALTAMLMRWPIDASLSRVQVDLMIDQTVDDMVGVTFRLPAAFAAAPAFVRETGEGRKFMPGSILVEVLDA